VSKAQARAQGWTSEQIEADSNLQAACQSCHKAKTAGERTRGG
jgi:5-methylcytosine-specific restriction protein A